MQRSSLVVFFLFCLFVIFVSSEAYASAGAGGGLPYESWLTTLLNSITGPYAFFGGMAGIVIAGVGLIFGSDLNAFWRSMLLIVMIMSMIIGAKGMMSTFFGKGAVAAFEFSYTIKVENRHA